MLHKIYLFLFFASLISLNSTAQVATVDNDGKIIGTLLDSASKAPVEFATIALFKVTDKTKPVDGSLTDDKGKFTIKNLTYGKYALKFTSIGFKEKTIILDEINARNKHLNLGNVVLSSDSKLLNEVVVTGQGAVIEEKVDRLIYNADKDITAKGGDAADILRKVPLLSVDLDGNVSLRGSSNIKVLINNKPSTIMAASISDALKQIPADQIKTVEVITSPSSKYDAEGSTGIINIITKKNNLEGYSLNTDIGAGNRGANLGLNGSLRTGKLGMTLGGFGRANYNPSETTFEQTTKGEIAYKTLQSGNAKDQMAFGRYSLGADYDISKNKSLSAGARFGTRSFNRDQDLTIDRFKGDTLLANTLQRINSKNPSNSWDFNIDYLHVIKPQKEFSISTLYSRSSANSDFTNTPLGNGELEKLALTNRNNNLNQEYTVQMDYQTPIKKNQLIEFGAKGIFREVNSDYSYLVGGSIITDPKRPNGTLDYNQNIGAAYLAYTYSTKSKYTFKLGTRYEVTDIYAKQNKTTEVDIPPYNILVPNVNISKTFGGKYTVKTGYNRRIQRPGLQQLNPNVNLVNPQNWSQGNPELKPEMTDNIEASVSASIKKLYLNLSLFSRLTNNAITQVATPVGGTDNGVVITSFQNIGKDKAYGANWSGNLSLTSKWMLNAGVEGFYNFISGATTSATGVSIPVANEGWNFNGRLMSFLTIKNGWQVQAFSFMRGGRVMPMGRQGGFGYYSLGGRKEFKNKKGSIGLSAQNLFTQYMKIKTTMESPLFYQNSVNYMFNRGVSVNFSYKLGKMGADVMQPKKRAKGVKNDDVKDGGEGGGQQGSTPQQGRN